MEYMEHLLIAVTTAVYPALKRPAGSISIYYQMNCSSSMSLARAILVFLLDYHTTIQFMNALYMYIA